MEGNSLSYSCRPTGLHGTMRLSLFAWICIRGLQIYRAMALFKFSSRSSARHSGAQLRLAPNRPCMTLVMFIILYVWYVRHARTAIDIVQRCAVYFKRLHENICVSIVTCFFDKGHFITTILVLCYCFSTSSTNTQSAEAKREKRLQRRRERERAHRAPYRSKQKAPKEDTLSEIEPVISSIAQGPAKNTIKID